MAWIIRVLFFIAAPIAALLVARDSLNFDIVQTFVAIILMIVLLGGASLWSARRQRKPTP